MFSDLVLASNGSVRDGPYEEPIMTASHSSLEVLVCTLQGEISGLNNRMDDMHRLMMVLIGIAGGGLVTAIVSVVLQLMK